MSAKEKIIEILKAYTKKHNISASSVILEEYADELLANGVILPPCKVGDTVYWLDDGKIKSAEVFKISIHSDGILVHTGIQFCLEQVFLTKEEAEKKLKELGK